MGSKGVAAVHRGKLRLLDFLNVVFHAFTLRIRMGQIEHVEPHAMNTRQRNKLVFVAHGGEFILEAGNLLVGQILLPVKGG